MGSAARRCAPGEDVIREELGTIRIERVLTDNAWA